VTHSAQSTVNNRERLDREAIEGAQSRAQQAAVQRVENLWCPVCGQRSPSDIKRLEKAAGRNYIWAGFFGLLTVAALVPWALSEFEIRSWVIAIIFGLCVGLSLMQAAKQKKSARAKVMGVPQPGVQFAAAPQAQHPYPQQQHPQAYPQQMR
jgi:hypothetical protein